MTQKAHSLEQEVVEIQGVGVVQRLLVVFENRSQFLRFGVDGVLIEILGRLLQVLGMTDAGKSRAMLHELFIVQPQRPVRRLDDLDLVLVVVNREAAGKARSDAGERVAVAPKHPDTERVERGYVGG